MYILINRDGLHYIAAKRLIPPTNVATYQSLPNFDQSIINYKESTTIHNLVIGLVTHN